MAPDANPRPVPAAPQQPVPAVSTIRAGAPVITLINVFTVEPARQRELLDVLVDATERRMRHLPGFVSANMHRSDDGRHVVNYAQWRTREDYDAALRDPEAGVHMRQAAGLAQFNPILCEVADVHHAGGEREG